MYHIDILLYFVLDSLRESNLILHDKDETAVRRRSIQKAPSIGHKYVEI